MTPRESTEARIYRKALNVTYLTLDLREGSFFAYDASHGHRRGSLHHARSRTADVDQSISKARHVRDPRRPLDREIGFRRWHSDLLLLVQSHQDPGPAFDRKRRPHRSDAQEGEEDA